MAIEIELKFVVTNQTISFLPEFLSRWPAVHQGKQDLFNTYYETDNYFLRQHRLGLRIRRFGDRYEMTLKAKGNVVAGLHQRPEYNVSLTEPKLSLALLPYNIWPQTCQLDELEKQLKPLFTTDYNREKWLISYQNSEIELALDCGHIKSGPFSEEIKEIELELKQGDVNDIIAFALELSALGGLRLCSQSKATRGYLLALQEPSENKPFSIVPIAPESTVEQAFQLALEAALSYWQYHEDIWLTGNASARDAVINSMSIIQQIWSLYNEIIPADAMANLRTQLQEIKRQISADNETQQICFQPMYVQTKLALTQYIMNMPWRAFINEGEEAELNAPFNFFADTMLNRADSQAKAALSDAINKNQYHDLSSLLIPQVITFKLLAGAYPAQVAGDYISKWENVTAAISQPQNANREAIFKQTLTQPVFWQIHSR